VVDIDAETSVLIADIPGLIEGAAQGKGLGHEFLRHVERTKVLIHLIDAYQEDVVVAYQTIQAELASYKVDLTDRAQVVGLNKTDGLDQDIVDDLLAQLQAVVPEGTKVFAISAQAGKGVKQLLYAVKAGLVAYRERQALVEEDDTSALPVLRLANDALAWRVSKVDIGFLVTGNKVEKFAARTDFSNEEGIQRLREIMRKMGITHELVRQGCAAGQKVTIGGYGTFEY
jgi:GTP-binding protein